MVNVDEPLHLVREASALEPPSDLIATEPREATNCGSSACNRHADMLEACADIAFRDVDALLSEIFQTRPDCALRIRKCLLERVAFGNDRRERGHDDRVPALFMVGFQDHGAVAGLRHWDNASNSAAGLPRGVPRHGPFTVVQSQLTDGPGVRPYTTW